MFKRYRMAQWRRQLNVSLSALLPHHLLWIYLSESRSSRTNVCETKLFLGCQDEGCQLLCERRQNFSFKYLLPSIYQMLLSKITWTIYFKIYEQQQKKIVYLAITLCRLHVEQSELSSPLELWTTALQPVQKPIIRPLKSGFQIATHKSMGMKR